MRLFYFLGAVLVFRNLKAYLDEMAAVLSENVWHELGNGRWCRKSAAALRLNPTSNDVHCPRLLKETGVVFYYFYFP